MLFIAVFFQCFFEGGGLEAYLAYILMGIMPEFIRSAAGQAIGVRRASVRAGASLPGGAHSATMAHSLR
jgi:hypothetical protein